MTQSQIPTNHPLLFKAKADLWVIVNTYSLFAFGRDKPYQRLAASDVLWFYKRLMAWLDDLPEPLTPRRIVFPHHLMLHMEFNLILMGILKPIVRQNWGDGPHTSRLGTPREAYLSATVRFETAVRLYYLRHGFEVFDSFLVNFLGTLGQMALDAMDMHQDSPMFESLKSTMMLAAKGLYDQSHSHYIAKAILRLQLGAMKPDDVRLFTRSVNIEPNEELEGPLEQLVQSEWPAYARAYEEEPENIGRKLELLSLDHSTLPAPRDTST